MGGRVADSSARVAQAMPTSPAAASAWPADDLCAASATGCLLSHLPLCLKLAKHMQVATWAYKPAFNAVMSIFEINAVP